jgi:dimethylargininase
MRIAVTRPVPESIASCELTHLERVPINYSRAAAQHRAYEALLEGLGYELRRVPAAHDLPDSVFVEDVALVLDEAAVITRPGAASRRPERDAVAAVLSDYRLLLSVAAPGTIDGGDVLRLGRRLYVGLSSRTNEDGAHQLARLAAPYGYSVECLTTAACLHLKSAVTAVADDRVIANPEWIDTRTFGDARVDVIEVDPAEPHAANVLRLGDTLVCASAHERTTARLRAHGYHVETVDVSELAKAEAGVTCCCVIIDRS